MRRNLATQPYARCSVCTLELPRCHAWQFSGLSFALVVSALAVLLVPPGWPQAVLVLMIIAQVVHQGMLNHKRTDELIFGQHELRGIGAKLREQNQVIARTRENLEHEVLARTAELRESNRALAQANLDALEAAKRREDTVVDLSHELRTPITSITGASQNLLDGVSGPLDADQREYVEIISERAKRVSRVAETIIDAARGTAPAVRLDARRCDVAEIVADVSHALQPTATGRNIRLESRTQPAEIEVDEDKLRTVLENLVSNALKFTDPGGEVLVSVAPDPAGASITVTDTGIGIHPDDQPKIFGRFYRSETTRPGTGVGLAIVRDLVRLHGGELELDSRFGEGSTFRVTLPRSAP